MPAKGRSINPQKRLLMPPCSPPTVVVTGDARLADARTPRSHTHPFAEITVRPTTCAGYGIADMAAAAEYAGVIKTWGGKLSSIPAGYLLCDGAAVSRVTYAALFLALGTIWGAGNGTTTFNLPNLLDRYAKGASAGQDAGGTGGSASYTPAGTVASIGATSTGAVTNVSLLGLIGSQAAAQGHTHPAPAFAGTPATIDPPNGKVLPIIKT